MAASSRGGRERPASAYAAIDLGAGSGRALLGCVRGERLELELGHRFAYDPPPVDGHERWDFAALWRGVREGLRAAGARAAARGAPLRSVGVDSWGVDYGLLDERGELLADPVSYRDARTTGMLERLLERVPRAE